MPPSNNSNEFKNTTASSGSSEGCSKNKFDDKKRRRMESNRESARRSRQKKQEHLDNLIKEVGGLKKQNEEFSKKIDEVSGIVNGIDAENNVLKVQKDGLAARLESLEAIIEIANVVKGSSSVNSDPVMKTWQLPYLSLPIMASSSHVHRFKF
ncbi:bZIP transcription factor 53 [Bienertia sinuspersici]